MRPLHKNLASKELRLENRHAGLWYDKYCDRWSSSWTLSSDGKGTSPKLDWIETLANDKGAGEPRLLTESIARLHALTEARRGRSGIFMTESRFVTGLGRSHPVENGFAWHPTLGVPYLPGSSVKGLVRAWAQREATPPPASEDLQRLLGPTKSARSAGHVVFLDAIPLAPVKLEADVMTPHYAGWTAQKPPGDWSAPVPVPFLVVAPHTPFLFSLLPRGIEPRELDTVFAWLRDALLGAGAGAKTAVGYGRFAYDEPRTEARTRELAQRRAVLEQAARLAQLAGTPEGRWLAQLEGKRESEVFELVRIHLDKTPIADLDDRRAFAQAVASLPFLARWRKGEKQDAAISGGRDLLKKRAKLVDDAIGSSTK